LHEQRKVTRSSAGGVEALALQHQQRAKRKERTGFPLSREWRAGAPPQEEWKLWPCNTNKERNEMKELDSRFRGNDEQGRLRRRSGSSGFWIRRRKAKSKKELDSSFRWNDEQGHSWIPAFAGMTSYGDFRFRGNGERTS